MSCRSKIFLGPPNPLDPTGRSEATDVKIGDFALPSRNSRAITFKSNRCIFLGPANPMDPGGRNFLQDNELDDLSRTGKDGKTPPPTRHNILSIAA